MARFTLPRDLYHGKGSLEALKTLRGKRAIVVVGGGSMKRFGFLDKVEQYLKEAGMEVRLFEGVEPDPSVETVMKGAAVMREFQPDWIVSIGGGSPIDAAKAMWAFYEYPDTTFEALCIPFNFPTLRTKARFCAIPSMIVERMTRHRPSRSSPTTRRASSIRLRTSISPPTWRSSILTLPRRCPRSSQRTPAWTP